MTGYITFSTGSEHRIINLWAEGHRFDDWYEETYGTWEEKNGRLILQDIGNRNFGSLNEFDDVRLVRTYSIVK